MSASTYTFPDGESAAVVSLAGHRKPPSVNSCRVIAHHCVQALLARGVRVGGLREIIQAAAGEGKARAHRKRSLEWTIDWDDDEPGAIYR